jgi:cardiolipin synthase (CMP-forming)
MIFNVPNSLTLFRLLLVPFFVVASMRGWYTTAFVLLMTAAATDILDGLIARRFNMRSRIGAVLDPLVDKTMMISGYLFYTFRDGLPMVRIPGWLTFVVFIRDFLILLFAYLLYTRTQIKKFPPSWAGKASLVLQAGTLGTVIGVNAFVPQLVWLAQVLFRMALVMTLFSGWDYIRRTERMLDQEVTARA